MRKHTAVRLGLAAALLWPLGCERGAGTPAANAEAPAPAAEVLAPPGERDPEPVAKTPPPLPTAGELHYHEILLGGATADEPLPMVVAIHGLGDDPRNFALLFEAFPEKARLILPQGVDTTEGGGWSWFPTRARDPDVEGLCAGITASADKVAAAIAVLLEKRPTTGEPIVTGFSQGGMLTLALAVGHPEAVGVAVVVGGWLPPPLWPESLVGDRYPETLALHGTADTAVQFEPTKASIDHLTRLGFPIELRAYEGVQHVITPEIRRDLHDRVVDAVRAAQGAK
jgi:phospholipase/carboxylesterase